MMRNVDWMPFVLTIIGGLVVFFITKWIEDEYYEEEEERIISGG